MEEKIARLKAELREILDRYSKNPAAEDGGKVLPCTQDDTGEGMTTEREARILEGAIAKWGERIQVDKAVEELGELIQALMKYCAVWDSPQFQGGRMTQEAWSTVTKENIHILEELADVIIVTKQLELIFGDPTKWEIQKLERLERMVQE